MLQGYCRQDLSETFLLFLNCQLHQTMPTNIWSHQTAPKQEKIWKTPNHKRDTAKRGIPQIPSCNMPSGQHFSSECSQICECHFLLVIRNLRNLRALAKLQEIGPKSGTVLKLKWVKQSSLIEVSLSLRDCLRVPKHTSRQACQGTGFNLLLLRPTQRLLLGKENNQQSCFWLRSLPNAGISAICCSFLWPSHVQSHDLRWFWLGCILWNKK